MKLPIKIREYNSGGPGGQHSNRTMNAIEASVTLPDGKVIKANSSTMKSQHRNKASAKKILASRVLAYLKSTEAPRDVSTERVRTYHEPDNRVIDHASGLRMSYEEVVGKRNLGPMIDARRTAIFEKELDENDDQ